MEIKKSNNYDLLKILEANRDIDESHVRKLVESINKTNLLSVNPIIVNKKLEILDGQHRFAACKTLKIPFYYIIIDNSKDYKDIITINTSSKNWTTKDYLEHYVQLGVFEYRILKKVYEKYHLPLSIITRILCTGNAPTKDFKDGMVRLKSNISEYYKMLDSLMDLLEFNININKTQLVYAFQTMYFNKDYQHNQLLKNLGLRNQEFQIRSTAQETLRALEDIYNYNKVNKVRFF